jgi:hypothetical protein
MNINNKFVTDYIHIMHKEVVVISILSALILYIAWKRGYLDQYMDKFTQISGNNFSSIENSVEYANSDLTTIFGKREGFNSEVASGGDENLTDALARGGLDKSVYDSHNEYVKDLDMLALFPSKQTIRDDYRPVVTQYGLPRSRPAETIPLVDARQTASEPDSHLAEYASRDVSFKL